MNIGTFVQNQWFTRGDDEKFASPEALHQHLLNRKLASKEHPVKMSDIEFFAKDDQLRVGDLKTKNEFGLTNWAFSQACATVDAHPSYLSKLPASLVAQCLNHGFNTNSLVKNRDLAFFTHSEGQLAGLTGGFYGRVWDSVVSNAALEIADRTEGRFYSPLDWSKEKRALFASDRDVTMLFIDGGSIVDGGMDARGNPDQLFRGLLWWNSEVGAGALKFSTFLFRWVCGNFGIHGIEDVQFTKIRHTINGPARFATDMLPKVLDYVNASPKKLEDTIRKARDFKLPADVRKFDEYFQHRRFTKAEIATAVTFADKEEGDHRTLWQMYNGFTASAREIRLADKAISLQQRSGKLLEQLAA
jgi:hypothetical protein